MVTATTDSNASGHQPHCRVPVPSRRVFSLLENTGLGVGLFSYDGRLCWGFNADYELVPDLRNFVRAVDSSFKGLAEAAGVKLDREGDRARDEARRELSVASPRYPSESGTGPNGPSVLSPT